MLANPALEFEFYLAQKLGRTVAQLRIELSAAEFIGWQMYYANKAQREELAMKMGGH